MSRTPRRRRERADWVYRSNTFDAAGTLVDGLGTYEASDQPFLAGLGGGARVLYDSHNRFTAAQMNPGNINLPGQPRAGRAEGRRAKIRAVQGVVIVRPSTWALGSVIRFGMRFGAFEQDPASPGFLIDPNYSLWSVTTATMFQPAVWANDRNWDHERRLAVTFSDNSQLFPLRFNFRVNRSLQPNMCYGIYMESTAGSVNLNLQFWLRTLVVDEG